MVPELETVKNVAHIEVLVLATPVEVWLVLAFWHAFFRPFWKTSLGSSHPNGWCWKRQNLAPGQRSHLGEVNGECFSWAETDGHQLGRR